MPERDNFEVLPLYAVVHEVACTREIKTTYLLVSRVLDPRSNTRLFTQGSKRGFDVFPYGTRSSGAILAPPCRCFVDLPYGARLDAYAQRQRSTVLAQTLEQFLG